MARAVGHGEGVRLDATGECLAKQDLCSASRRVVRFALIFFGVVSFVIGVVGLSMRGGPIVRSLGRSGCVALTVVGAPFILFLLASISTLRTNFSKARSGSVASIERASADTPVRADVVGLSDLAAQAIVRSGQADLAEAMPTYLPGPPPTNPDHEYMHVEPGQETLQPGQWCLTEGGLLVVKTHPFSHLRDDLIEYRFEIPVLPERPVDNGGLFAQLFRKENGEIALLSSVEDSGDVIVMGEQNRPVLSTEGVRRLVAHYGWLHLNGELILAEHRPLGRIDDPTIFNPRAHSLVDRKSVV